MIMYLLYYKLLTILSKFYNYLAKLVNIWLSNYSNISNSNILLKLTN